MQWSSALTLSVVVPQVVTCFQWYCEPSEATSILVLYIYASPPVITRLHRERGRRCTHLERTLFFGSQSASMCILSWYAILSLSRWWARSHNPTTSPSRLCIVVLHRIVEDLKSNSVEISYRCPPPLRSTTVEFNGLSERNVTFIGAVRAS